MDFAVIVVFLSFVTIQLRAVEYTGAVVEYVIKRNDSKSPKDNMMDNLNQFKTIISDLPKHVDIVVFPENALLGPDQDEEVLTIVPNPSYSMPDLTDKPILSELSKSAIDNQIYIVVNLVEKEKDKKYNTNVVFRKNGTIAAKYRKYNLFNENVDRPDKPDSVWFDTEMGVKFGIFTCFDILFKEPALDLVDKNITDFLYPTHWFSELPFLTASQTQRGWSWATRSNILAAGKCNVSTGSTGSALFSNPELGDTQNSVNLTYHMTEIDEITVIIRKLTSPLNVSRSTYSNGDASPIHINLKDYKSDYNGSLKLLGENMKAYKLSSIEPKNSIDTDCKNSTVDGVLQCNTNRTICHNKLCCKFQVSMLYHSASCPKPSGNPNEFLLFPKKLVAFSGVRDFGGAATGGMDVCGIVTCPNNKCYTAPSPPDKPLVNVGGVDYCIYEVKSVRIDPEFPSEEGFIFPSVLSGQLNTTGNYKFGVVATDGGSVTWKNRYLQISGDPNLGTAGLLRRVFSRDGKPPTQPDGAASDLASPIIVASVLCVTILRQLWIN